MRRLRFDLPSIRIGRGDDCELSLPADPLLGDGSALEWHAGSLFLFPLRGSGDTVLNSVKVNRPLPLSSGDVIRSRQPNHQGVLRPARSVVSQRRTAPADAESHRAAAAALDWSSVSKRCCGSALAHTATSTSANPNPAASMPKTPSKR